MAAAEWAELDNLTHAITDLRVRQEAAKSVGSQDVVETIDQEVAVLEERRNQLLGELAQGVVKTPEFSDETPRTERPSIVWDQLTPADVQRAKDEIDVRRTEMLARHAAELQALDVDGAEVDAVDQAIAAFIEKFGVSNGAEVVALNPERNSRHRTAS
jgi:hypothetical protein